MSHSTPACELTTYHGNCHCGAVKFSVTIPELKSVDQCNCSICSKKAYRWIQGGDVVVTKGEGTLRDYRFGKGGMAHLFCGVCGTAVLGRMEGYPPGVNANALDYPATQLFDLPSKTYDGKAIDPQYTPPKFAGTEPPAEIEGAKTYYGGCHCGDVTVAMKNEGDIEDKQPECVLECDCSICTKDGTILTYPLKTALSVHASSPTALTTYTFGRQLNEHKFCSRCGVYIYIHKKEHVDEEYWKKYKGDASQERWRRTQPVNLRIFDGVDWEVLREKGLIERGDWSMMEPMYVIPE